jgi:glycosyltransferase involved in cell wall biosynthesis
MKKVSVIMPVFNTEKYVREAITSVLNQTYTNIELICIDDGSTDGSLKILQSFGDKITVIDSGKNLGIAESRNAGFRVATGDYFALMDADDIWKLNKIELQMHAFEKDPTLDVCFCFMQCFISPELPEETKKLRYNSPDPMPGQVSAATMIKKSSFDRVGYFNTQLTVGEFVDWFTKAKEIGLTSTMIPEVLLLRRIHDSNIGVRERDARSDYIKIVREALLRKKNK